MTELPAYARRRSIGLAALAALLLVSLIATLPRLSSHAARAQVPGVDPNSPALAGLDLQAFLDVARAAMCADRVNRMWGIDGKMVYWHTEGNCSDAAFGSVLFGQTPDSVLCSGGDSIAGPRMSCTDPAGQAVFGAIDSSLPDLGLGADHQVALFNDGKPPCPPVSGAPNDSAYIVTTLAGSDAAGFADGTGDAAAFRAPLGLAVDAAGNVYVADSGNNAVRRIAPDGTVTTLAGSGQPGNADGVGATAQFRRPAGVAVTATGDVIVADLGNLAVRRIAPDGTVTTIADRSALGITPESVGVDLFRGPVGVAAGSDGSVYVLESARRRLDVIAPDGSVSVLADMARLSGLDQNGLSDGGNAPAALAIDAGNLVVYMLKADGVSYYVTTLAADGSVTRTSVPPTQHRACIDARHERRPQGIAVDGAGTVYLTDTDSHQIRALAPGGAVTAVAGTGAAGSDDGPVATAGFGKPVGLAADSSGNIFVADGNRIRKITPPDTMSPLVGP